MNSSPSMLNIKSDKTQYYWQELGLKHDPFANTASEILNIAQWEDYFEVLFHLIQYSNILGVVSGDSGVGKTSFIDQFNQRTGSQISFSTVKASAQWGIEQFIHVINISIGFAQNEISAESLEMINAHLPSGDKKYIIAIDNAESLSEEVILLLKEWTRDLDDHIRLRFILVANTDISHRLKLLYSTQEHGDLLSILELKPLNLKQTHEYLEHCLGAADFEGDFLFSHTEVKKIYKNSDGIFVKINERARRLLIDKLVKNKGINSIVQENSKIFLLGAIGLVILSVFLFSNSPEIHKDQNLTLPAKGFASAKQFSDSEETLLLDLTTLDDIEKQQGTPFLEDTVQTDKSVILTYDKLPNELTDTASLNDGPTHDKLPSKLIDSALLTDKASDNKLSSKLTKTALLTDKPAGNTPSSKLTKTALLTDKPADNKPSSKVRDGILLKSAIPLRKKITISESPKVIKERASIILEEPDGNYTIQLMAANTSVSAANFIIRNQLEDNANYYINSQQSKLWYAVIYGSYKTKKDARLAVTKMPSSLRKNNPWIRKFAEVQKIIKSRVDTQKN